MLRVSSAFQCSVQHVLNSFIFTVEHNSSIVDCLNSCTCRIYACLISSDTRSIMFSSFFPLLLHCLAGRTGLHFWLQQLVILLCTVYSASFLLPPHQSPESEIWNPKLNHPTGSLTACGVASGLIFFLCLGYLLKQIAFHTMLLTEQLEQSSSIAEYMEIIRDEFQ